MELWEEIDPKLVGRAKGLLRDLTLLSYAPTQGWKTQAAGLVRGRIVCPSCHGEGCGRCHKKGDIVDENTHHYAKVPHHESKVPPPCESLYEVFIGPVSHAFHDNDGFKLAGLCVAMETAIARYRGLSKPEMTLPTDDDAAMKKVVEWGVGLDPIEVARRLQVAPGWVEKARRTERRDPKTGEKLEGWRGLSDEERDKKIAHAKAQRWSIRYTATTYGVSTTVIHRNYGWGLFS